MLTLEEIGVRAKSAEKNSRKEQRLLRHPAPVFLRGLLVVPHQEKRDQVHDDCNS